MNFHPFPLPSNFCSRTWIEFALHPTVDQQRHAAFSAPPWWPLPASCHPRCCGQPWLIRCWARICCGSWMHPPVQTLCPVHHDSYQAVGFMILECGELEMHDLSYMVRCYDQVGGFWETPTVLPFVFSYLFMFLDVGMRQSDEAWISLEWIHIELDETFSFPGYTIFEPCPIPFIAWFVATIRPPRWRALAGVRPRWTRWRNACTSNHGQDNAWSSESKGNNCPTGHSSTSSSTGWRWGYDDHAGSQLLGKTPRWPKMFRKFAVPGVYFRMGRKAKRVPVCRFSCFFLGPLIRPLLWKTVNGLQVEAFSWGFSLLNFLMNVGQFTLPVLFVRHGWFAILLIALGSALCAHTALLMSDALVQFTGHKRSRFWYVLA